jgi:hypothetical protein
MEYCYSLKELAGLSGVIIVFSWVINFQPVVSDKNNNCKKRR